MKITLNLATRPYADQGPALKRLRIGIAALVVVLIALGFGLMHFHSAALAMAAQEEQVDRRIAAVQQEEHGYEAQMQQLANARVLTQAQFLNKLFEEKSFSWTAAMEDLERVLPAGVQVTAIEPSRGKDGRLTLRLRISGLRERAVATVRNMEHSRRFVSPRISGENSESNNGQGELQPVRDAGRVTFEVLAEYDPATLEERREEIATQRRTRPVAAVPQPLAPLSGPRIPYVPPTPRAEQMAIPQVAPPGSGGSLLMGTAPGVGPYGPMGNRTMRNRQQPPPVVPDPSLPPDLGGPK